MDNKFKYAFAIGGFIIFVIVAIIFIKKEEDIAIYKNTANYDTFLDSGEEIEEEKIYVYIVGAVQKPGIIVAPIESRVFEIIDLAGGSTKDADLNKINLAEIVSDGQKIIIPFVISGDLSKDINKKYYSETENSKININTASIAELETLNGIGNAIALNIVTYREKQGKFKKLEDIKNVTGIGESKFNSIKDKITI